MTQEDKEQKLDETTQAQTEPDEEQVNALARKYRHIGFAIFGGLALVLVVFLLYSVIPSLNSGDVYDPFTGEKIATGTDTPASE